MSALAGEAVGAVVQAPARVLVVDDTESKRYVTSQWLRRAGYSVVEAATGTRALELSAAGGLDLVVLDVHLPDLSGLEVCRRLRAQPVTAAVPVLHISAVATDPQDRVAGLDQGADAYLVDPIDPAELVSTAAVLVRRSRARTTAERLAEQLGRLGGAALRINAATSLTHLVAAAAEGAAAVLEAPALVVAAGEGAGWAAATAGPGQRTSPEPVGARVAALLRDLRGPVTVDPQGTGWAAALPAGLAAAPCLVVPVVAGAAPPTAAVVVPAGAVPGPAEELLVSQLALVVAVAAENRRRYAEEHRTALELQRSLLPGPRPQVPGLAVAARYRATEDGVEVGGDFYDAFTLDDGRAVVVVGDVQGHSLRAAAVMGQLRHSLRTLAHEGHVGASLVSRLDRLLDRDHPDLTATVCVVVVDAARTSAVVVNAGHIPPVLLVGASATLVEGRLPLLGVGAAREEPGADEEPPVVALPPGARLLMVTDGLVERRDEHLDVGIAAVVATALEHADDDLAALADAVMERHARGALDDAALVVVETGPAAPPGGRGTVSVVFPPDAVSVQRARRTTADALREAGLAHLVDDACLLVSELAGNAVLHARTPFRLTVTPAPGSARVEVTDLSPAPPSLVPHTTTATTGRGLLLVQALAAGSGSDHDASGGKRVWFVVDGAVRPSAEAAVDDLVAAWASAAASDAAVPEPGASRGLRRVVVPGVRTALLLSGDEHVEDLVREAQLLLLSPPPDDVADGAPDAARRAVHLRSARRLDDAARAVLAPRREAREAAQRAAAAGEEETEVTMHVTPAAAADLERYRTAIDEAELALRGSVDARWSAVRSAFFDSVAAQLLPPGAGSLTER